jgi:hypothetical protein
MRYQITTKNKGYRKEALYTEIAPQMTVSRGKYGAKYSFFSYHSQKTPKIAQISSVTSNSPQNTPHVPGTRKGLEEGNLELEA